MINKQKEFLRQKKNEQRKGKRTLADMLADKKEEEEGEEEVKVEDREEDREFREKLAAVIGDGNDSDEIIGKLSNLVAEMFPLNGPEFYQCMHCMMVSLFLKKSPKIHFTLKFAFKTTNR